jgi:hypothetical protein
MRKMNKNRPNELKTRNITTSITRSSYRGGLIIGASDPLQLGLVDDVGARIRAQRIVERHSDQRESKAR